MSFYYKKVSDSKVVRAFTHKLADLVNGVTIMTDDLNAGDIIAEGTPIGKGADGKYHVIKTARLTASADASAKVYKVAKGHNIKVGEVIYAVANGAGYAVTKVENDTTKANTDKITLGTSLGVVLNEGDAIAVAGADGASGAKAKYKAVALVGEAYEVNKLGSLMVNAVTIGQLKGANAPAVTADIKAELPAIVYI